MIRAFVSRKEILYLNKRFNERTIIIEVVFNRKVFGFAHKHRPFIKILFQIIIREHDTLKHEKNLTLYCQPKIDLSVI